MINDAIQLRNISHKYKDKYILKDINLFIAKKSVNMIIGSSGSGKTTLLNIMSGIQSPTIGTVYRCSENIGCLFQYHFLVYELTVEENLMLAMHIKNIYNKQFIYYILKELNINDKAHCYPSELSVGEQHRVSLARTLLSNPDIIFADEPTASIDPKNADNIMSILLHLDCTVIITTHNYSWLAQADEVIDMGTLLASNITE